MSNQTVDKTDTCYCRKCTKELPVSNFYDSTDAGFIDTNGKMSVCKDCIQNLYDALIAENQSMEKTLHRLCVALNIRYSNEVVAATKAHIQTMLENGKQPRAIFGIYKSKLVSSRKSMDKSSLQDDSYEDVGTIFVTDTPNVKEIPIPQNLVDFWGEEYTKEDIQFLEKEYANFKQTHKTDTYAEIVLLKRVCYTLLKIKKLDKNQDDTDDLVKELQSLMKNLAISPNAKTSKGEKAHECLGLWIKDIEEFEPCQWLMSDPRGDIYRDVANTEEYFEKYTTRPLKNFTTNSRDFNVEDEAKNEDVTLDEEVDFGLESGED